MAVVPFVQATDLGTVLMDTGMVSTAAATTAESARCETDLVDWFDVYFWFAVSYVTLLYCS